MHQQKKFDELEASIDTLIADHQSTMRENEVLRKKLAKLLQEKAVWLNKKEKTIAKIKQIIMHMKTSYHEHC